MRGQRTAWRLLTGVMALAIGVGFYVLAAPGKAGASASHPAGSTVAKFGELDCNGFSTLQRSVRPSSICADIRGFDNVDNANTWSGRFYDNGRYIGHDEPDMTFNSSTPGSGDRSAGPRRSAKTRARRPRPRTPATT